MIYLILFCEFFKIGLFAVGGGLVTIPFLFALSEKYGWFSVSELTDMIAVGESTPGPIGVNVATFAGFSSAGVFGGVVATTGLVLPSFIVIVLLSKALDKYKENPFLNDVLNNLRPAVIALILFAGLAIGKMAVVDAKTAVLCAAFCLTIAFVRLSPIAYIVAGAVAGVILKL